MKRTISLILAGILTAAALTSCGSKGTNANASDTTAAKNDTTAASVSQGEKLSGNISVIIREDGSGTRSAFVELMEITDADGNDASSETAEQTSSTSVMITSVAGDKNAIGYISLGSLSKDVKAVNVDGVAATVDDIKSGDYKVSRPFLLAYQEAKLTDNAKDFIDFIMSSDGQKVISDNGYISVEDNAKKYTNSGLSGKVTLAGSTSVSPVMDKLKDAYQKLNPGVEIEIQQSGSSAGITSAIEGVCDIGMSSRELKESEATELTTKKIALDGIAVIVNNANSIDNLTSEQIQKIFKGETAKWSDIG